MRSGAERGWLFPLAAAVILVGDLLTKAAVEATLDHGRIVPVLGEWFQLRLVYNQGAAFGLYMGAFSRWIFLAIGLAAMVLLWRMARGTPGTDRFRHMALGLVAGGAAGNVVDRIRSSNGVVDFLDVGVGALRWPTFNLADIGVTCGAVALAVSLWMEDARRTRAERSAA